MSLPSSSFYRGLSPAFLNALGRLADQDHGQWWRDVLARRDLVIAVRREALNVYYRGASIFLVELRGSDLVPITHAKYLARRQQGLVPLQPDGRFALDPDAALWRSYNGPETLAEMVKAAADLAGPEKIGLHALLLASPNVIDLEISLEGEDGPEPESRMDGVTATAEQEADGLAETAPPTSLARWQDRIDVATLEERGGQVWVVFHEAKHFGNSELRSGPTRPPPVAEQIGRYRRAIARHAQAIAESYRDVCQALVRIEAMRRRVQAVSPTTPALDPLISRVAEENLICAVDPEPRLVVFGFDQDQRDGLVWAKHRGRLTAADEFGLKLYAVGNTGVKRSPAFR